MSRCIEELSWEGACQLTPEHGQALLAWFERVNPPLWSRRPEHSSAQVAYDLGTVWAKEPRWRWAIQVNARHYLGDMFGWVPLKRGSS